MRLIVNHYDIDYIDDDFTLFYAPCVVQNIEKCWLTDLQHRSSFQDILEKAKQTVLGWKIKDEVDRIDQQFVLNTANKLLREG